MSRGTLLVKEGSTKRTMKNEDIKSALKVVSDRYSEQQLMKAQDIVGDLMDEVGLVNDSERNACEKVFELLSDAINLDA